MAFSHATYDAQACGQRMEQRMTLPLACKIARLIARHLLLWTCAALCRKPPLLRARFSNNNKNYMFDSIVDGCLVAVLVDVVSCVDVERAHRAPHCTRVEGAANESSWRVGSIYADEK